MKLVEKQIRRMLLDRYRAYRAGGLSGVAPYARGEDRDFDPAGDLRKGVEAAYVMKKFAPSFRRALLDYPDTPPDFRQRFFWVNFELDGKPTFALVHRAGLPMNGQVALSDRHYYVSRSHDSVQALGDLVPVEQGTFVFYLNRTSTDRAAGFGASTKHALGRRIMGEAIAEDFEEWRAEATRD